MHSLEYINKQNAEAVAKHGQTLSQELGIKQVETPKPRHVDDKK